MLLVVLWKRFRLHVRQESQWIKFNPYEASLTKTFRFQFVFLIEFLMIGDKLHAVRWMIFAR